jgi:hypothetical protein
VEPDPGVVVVVFGCCVHAIVNVKAIRAKKVQRSQADSLNMNYGKVIDQLDKRA